jgi:hypothetical protein
MVLVAPPPHLQTFTNKVLEMVKQKTFSLFRLKIKKSFLNILQIKFHRRRSLGAKSLEQNIFEQKLYGVDQEFSGKNL